MPSEKKEWFTACVISVSDDFLAGRILDVLNASKRLSIHIIRVWSSFKIIVFFCDIFCCKLLINLFVRVRSNLILMMVLFVDRDGDGAWRILLQVGLRRIAIIRIWCFPYGSPVSSVVVHQLRLEWLIACVEILFFCHHHRRLAWSCPLSWNRVPFASTYLMHIFRIV